ncbi:MAG: leucine--tRNA ligase, partial [Acidobacteriota bacterium]|nr:leucine--tRNA ligase [Acidobacteriota bacterium]
PKYYVLDMFPYPSGSGLHVGHPVGYIGSDIVARRKRMEGFNVLHPMGWDAFGLPAEQYAIQTGKHPAETTLENVTNFKRQLSLIGLAYDWDREINTSHVEFYRWTQWIFAKLYDKGLVYQAEVPVWWCEELKTVLANEEVINGRSERGDHPCVRRPLKQWMFRITEYADRLLEDLDDLDWPESIKAMQRAWIGRSDGAEIRFAVENGDDTLTAFTTRPDTLFGATFMVVAPEHPIVEQLTTAEHRDLVTGYVRAAAAKSEMERTELDKEKTGVPTGAYALNPLLPADDPRARIPIWVADYVLFSYGTGAIMAVPGHDERDHEFARRHDLAIREVVRPPDGEDGLQQGVCFTGDGTSVDSGPIDGLPSKAAQETIVSLLEERGVGKRRVTYKIRDWLFSRQRYWGEPFPFLHLEDGTTVRVPEEDLPVELPEMKDFRPASDGSAPLARATDWVHQIDPSTGQAVRRDTDTMPGWAGSCWYWLRFMDPRNDRAPFDPEAEKYWGPVDLYIGGASHAVMHLLYARFWHKALADLGIVSTAEPFGRLFNQGMLVADAFKDDTGRNVPSDEVEQRDGTSVRGSDGAAVHRYTTAMSKSKRNVINPDDVIADFGADAFRLYEMFMAPLADQRTWDTNGITGCRRFLDRMWKLFVDAEGELAESLRVTDDPATWSAETRALEFHLNQALKRIADSFEAFNFNTGIAALMSLVNEVVRTPQALVRSQAERWLRGMAPLAPHICEELWSRLGHEDSICIVEPPTVDEAFLQQDNFELVVQVLGKLRGRVQAPRDADRDTLEALARDTVAQQLEGKQIVKTIVVPGRLVNFVVR